jgi:hypothetical protein
LNKENQRNICPPDVQQASQSVVCPSVYYFISSTTGIHQTRNEFRFICLFFSYAKLWDDVQPAPNHEVIPTRPCVQCMSSVASNLLTGEFISTEIRETQPQPIEKPCTVK